MSMLAVIRTGGKQYLVSEGTRVKIEKAVKVGAPVLEKATVTGTVLAQERHDKVTGIKHKAKKRELTRYGHRQAYTEVEITKIAA